MAKINLPMMIGGRYSRAKRRNGFISFISAISMIGIALGVWAIISVVSVMSGFSKELRGSILEVTHHVTISDGNGWIDNWQSLSDKLDKNADVKGHAPYINSQGLINHSGTVTGALVQGILPDEERNVGVIHDYMLEGSLGILQKGGYNIVLGDGLAAAVNANIGDKITLISPQGQSTPAGLVPRLRRFTVVGIFGGVGPAEYTSNLAFIHLADASKLFKTKSLVSGVRVTLDNPNDAAEIATKIAADFDFRYFVSNWTLQHEAFFRALQLERTMVFIIMFLIVVVAAINIVSTLVMVVTDKRSDIAILRTIGLAPNKIMGIFFVQGITAGLIGTLFGTIAGILTALNLSNIIAFLEIILGHQVFPQTVYIISDFPAELKLNDVLIVVFVSITISMLATLFPAWRASKTQPAEALRYE